MSIQVNKGDKYNRLTVIKEVEPFVQPSGQKQRGILCECECGNKKRVRLSHLRHNRVTSCSCVRGVEHGDVGTRMHNMWRGMKNRCKERYEQSHLYADRGIEICEEWDNDYLAFKDWALENGYKENLTIDRKDNHKGYYPNNCRFVSQFVNNCNRRNTFYVTYKGKEISFMLLLKRKGLEEHEAAIRSRIKRGWNVDDAFDKPIRQGNYR